MGSAQARRLGTGTVVLVVAAAAAAFGVIGALRLDRDAPEGPREQPLRVPRFVDPALVQYDRGIVLAFDPPAALTALRLGEALDRVVAGAATDEERAVRLMRWSRRQFEPGRPDPYPPPDATVILTDIRAGHTGGFCAQYCFVLVQAGASLGLPIRMVTVDGHELSEAWLGDERRWVLLDPLYSLQVLDDTGRSLSALEVRRAWSDGRALRLSSDHLYPGDAAAYAAAFRRLAVWARNDFVSRPLNFADFDRCRVWVDPAPGDPLPAGALSSADGSELYRPPPGL